MMRRPNIHQLLAASFGVRDVDVCITYQGATPISVTIRGRKLAFQRACTIAGIRH